MTQTIADNTIPLLISIITGLSGILLGWIMFGRSAKKDRKQSDEEIREAARKEADRDSKLDMVASGIQEIKYSFKTVTDQVGIHALKFVAIEKDVQNLSDKIDQHISTHPPNIPTNR